jgi:hypothetical protein
MMATKRSTTKALKAKAVTKAQSEPGDGVSVVLGRQRNLIADLDEHEQSAESCKQKGNHDDAAFMRQYTSVFWDRISMGCEELSWLTPETTEGALFALVVAYASLTHLNAITDPDFREQRRRRGVRLLYAVRRCASAFTARR